MNEVKVQITPRIVETREPAKLAVLDVRSDEIEQPGPSRIPLTVRGRKVLRMAPPIDDGFRPFRVF